GNRLFKTLDTFGDDFHAHVVGEVDQCFDDAHRIVVAADGVDENLVDLDDVDAELQHVRQTGMARPYVVDRHLHAELLDRGDHAARRSQALHRLPFGQLQDDL